MSAVSRQSVESIPSNPLDPVPVPSSQGNSRVSTFQALTLQTKLAKLQCARIPHYTYCQGVKALEAFRRLAPLHVQPPRPRAGVRLLHGPPGAGVTAVVDELEDLLGARCAARDGNRALIRLAMPLRPTATSLSAALRRTLGLPIVRMPAEGESLSEIAEAIEKCHTELLVIEEAQTAFLGGKASEIAAFLKSLVYQIGSQLVLAGSSEIAGFHSFASLHGRLAPDVVLGPYDWQDRHQQFEFRVLLGRFERLLALADPSDLHAPDFARRLYVASGGLIGAVAEYLTLALELADEHQLRCLDLELMAEVYAAKHQRRQVPLVIDFSTRARAGQAETLETLRQAAGDRFDREANPFACSVERLSMLFADQGRRHELDRSKPRSRQLRLL